MALSVPYVFTAGTTILSDEVDANFTALLDATDKRGDTMTGPLVISSTLQVSGATTLTTPLTVANGGTGRNTATTAYAVLAAGTTATGVQQSIAPSTSGYVLTDNGVGVLPSFQATTASGLDYVQSQVFG